MGVFVEEEDKSLAYGTSATEHTYVDVRML